MKSIRIIALNNLLRKKSESLLIGLSMTISVLALGAAFGLLAGFNKPYESMVRELNGAHFLMFFDTRIHDPDQVKKWLKTRPGVVAVTPSIPIYQTNLDVFTGDNKLQTSLLLTEHDLGDSGLDRLIMVESREEEPSVPGIGEIWIPKRLAGAENIRLGDTIRVPSSDGMHDFLVSGLVVDPNFSTTAISPTRCWVRPGTLAFTFPAEDLTRAYLGARLEDPDSSESLQQALNNHFGGNFAGFSLHYGLFKLAHGIFLRMLGIALLIVSILAMIIAVFTVSASITSAIYADYRLIGIYKTLGMTPGQVRTIYAVQYLLLSTLFVPLGWGAAVLAIHAFFNAIIRAVGLVNLSFPATLPALAGAVVIVAVVGLTAWWTSRLAARIKPMEAIRFGAPILRKRGRLAMGVGSISLPIPIFLGARGLFLNAKRTLLAVIGLIFTVWVLVFSVNISSTFNHIGDHLGLLGVIDGDLTVRLSGQRFRIKPDQFKELMDREPGVRGMIGYGSLSGTVPENQGKPSRTIRGTVFDGDMDIAGLQHLEGRIPSAPDEISIGLNTAKLDNKKIGDGFGLFLEGQLQQFKVVGIYQTGQNLGDGFRLRSEPVKNLNPIWQPSSFAISLDEGVSPGDFKAGLKQRFAEAITVTTSIEDSREFARQVSGVNMALLFISLFLLGVSFIAIFNDTMLSIKEQHKIFGILKTSGMTPFQLRASLAFKACFIAGLALVIGLPLGVWGIPLLLNGFVSGIGMASFPFSIDLLGTFLIVPGLLGFAFVCAWLPSRAAVRIPVRSLIHQ